MSQPGHNPHGYNPVTNQHRARSSKLLISIQTLAINLSMSQPGHDPHGYNPVTNQRHYTGCNLVSYLFQYRH